MTKNITPITNDAADCIVVITTSPRLDKQGMCMHTYLKNRFGPKMISEIKSKISRRKKTYIYI